MPALMVAIDTDCVKEAYRLVDNIPCDYIKIGMELMYAPGGREFVRSIRRDRYRDRVIMLDAKLADIPTTNVRTAAQLYRNWEFDYLTVRTAYKEILKEIPEASGSLVYVPCLTSDEHQFMPPKQCLENIGLGGIVCSAWMAKEYKNMGYNIDTFVPGIRPDLDEGQATNDHVNAAKNCPEATFVIIGRPITRAEDSWTRTLEIKEKLGLT